MIRTILFNLLLDIFIAVIFVLIYHLIDRIAIDIIYGKGIAKFDNHYQLDRLVSISVVGLIPIINVVCLCYILWTFGDRVESFVWSIYRLAQKKHGVIVRKTRKKEIKDDIM